MNSGQFPQSIPMKDWDVTAPQPLLRVPTATNITSFICGVPTRNTKFPKSQKAFTIMVMSGELTTK